MTLSKCFHRYVSELCKLDSPEAPVSCHLVSPELPLGVALLDYIYNEAMNCTDESCYYLLLYLLRTCCQPYLEFVQVRFVAACFLFAPHQMRHCGASRGRPVQPRGLRLTSVGLQERSLLLERLHFKLFDFHLSTFRVNLSY